MYTIGEFSVITGITKKTLRYYDEINLLKSKNVNKQNGYRQYSEVNIITANKILTFKNFGLSLAEIKRLIRDNDSSNLNLNMILIKRMSEIDNNINELKSQIKRIKKYCKKERSEPVPKSNFIINKTLFKSGQILYLDFISDESNYHSFINEFYDYSSKNNCKLISNHYIKKYIDNNENEKIRIFAFVMHKKNEFNIEEIENYEVLEIICPNISNKNLAYKQLINHGKSMNIEIKECIEEYSMQKGKLTIKIYGIIK